MADAPLTDDELSALTGVYGERGYGAHWQHAPLIRRALAELRSHRTAQRGEWRSMDSAPKDGTRVLLSNGDWVAEGAYHTWEADDKTHGLWKPANALRFPINKFNPVRWMPLPTPPEISP